MEEALCPTSSACPPLSRSCPVLRVCALCLPSRSCLRRTHEADSSTPTTSAEEGSHASRATQERPCRTSPPEYPRRCAALVVRPSPCPATEAMGPGPFPSRHERPHPAFTRPPRQPPAGPARHRYVKQTAAEWYASGRPVVTKIPQTPATSSGTATPARNVATTATPPPSRDPAPGDRARRHGRRAGRPHAKSDRSPHRKPRGRGERPAMFWAPRQGAMQMGMGVTCGSPDPWSPSRARTTSRSRRMGAVLGG